MTKATIPEYVDTETEITPTDVPEPEPAPTQESGPLRPADYARLDISGIPITIDGVEWLIPHAPLEPALDEIRDKIIDDDWKRGKHGSSIIRLAASILFGANYEIEYEQRLDLIEQADPQELSDIVSESLIAYTDRDRDYRAWVESACIANNLDPYGIEPAILPHVLQQLVLCGRAAPPDAFITVALNTTERATFLAGLPTPTRVPADPPNYPPVVLTPEVEDDSA